MTEPLEPVSGEIDTEPSPAMPPGTTWVNRLRDHLRCTTCPSTLLLVSQIEVADIGEMSLSQDQVTEAFFALATAIGWRGDPDAAGGVIVDAEPHFCPRCAAVAP